MRCPKNKIINPKTGICVLRTGRIGSDLVKSKQIFTDLDKYNEYVEYRKQSHDTKTSRRRYDLEQKYYKSSPAYKEAQRQRAKNRAAFVRAGLVKKGDGTQIHHKNGNPTDNRMTNLIVVRNVCEHNKLHNKRCDDDLKK